MSVEERDSSKVMWPTIFVLLSLLAHIIAILVVLLISIHMPTPKLPTASQPAPEVTLSLVAPPPKPQPKQRIFMTTNPAAATKTPQKTPVEADVTTALQSQTPKARTPDSILPDMAGKKNMPPNFQETPFSPPSKTQQTAANPSAQPQKNQQQPTQTQVVQNQPPQPKQPPTPPKPPEKAPPTPPKPPAPQVVRNNYPPDGLPVLPPIAAPTIEPQTPVSIAQQMRTPTAARPPPSFQLDKSDVSGSQGLLGNNSPAANATDLGRYKAKFYRAVGSRWYAKVGQSFQLLPVGTVRIQYTIHSDGIVDNIKILEGNNSSLQILLSISQNSITEASPFDPFPDSVRKEVGESYTDDFTFSIYGG